ncbi:aspartate aminotransferase family protein [Egicoccus sp. AB-alg6-2]|uniref:pyridoxal phosphate-dependent decarboxylase family protein n=1 Tax=Egicoccus sp. AB-alg6-2 TaxID=3242692 RepID=UPI00359DB772
MQGDDWDAVLDVAVPAARRWFTRLPERRVHPDTSPEEIRAVVDRPLPDAGTPAPDVVAELARDLEPFIAAHASGRYFGFVIGGLLPAAYGAELLVATWDQNAGLYAPTPGVTVVEETATRWLVELLGLPPSASVGLVTGGQMANFTCLAAARDQVLRDAGWDVEADGLAGAPPVHLVAKAGRHVTIGRAARFLGLGERRIVEVAGDDQDRFVLDDLRQTLAGLSGPTIVCAEAGNVNTGAFDRFDAIADAAERHRAAGNPTWVHVDGAVGLLAAASPTHARLVAGLDRLDSWSTDGHKLLNVAYDCGIAVCRHEAAHRAAMSVRADYLIQGDGGLREAMDFNPEFSRRARGVGIYAALRQLGRAGVAAMVEQATAMARRFAAELAASGHAEVVNDVVFNQVLVRWRPPAGVDPDTYNDAVVAAVQRDGTAYVSGTTWRGHRHMRISVSNWATGARDVDRTVTAMLRCAASVAGEDAPASRHRVAAGNPRLA